MVDLAAQYAAMDRAIRAVADTGQVLTDEQKQLTTSMQSMLDGEWTGAAAEAFRAAFDDWSTGAAGVLEGLHSMSLLIEQAKRLLVATDDQVSSSVNGLSTRLGSLPGNQY